MHVKLTEQSLKWLDGHNISFHNRFGVRLRPGDYISFPDNLEVEPYIGIHAGNTICDIGFMSYTNSPVPEDLTIGRYSSLARNVRFPRNRHPIEHISTSIFTHDTHTDLVVRVLRDASRGGDYRNFYRSPQKGPVVIGHDVWIGETVMILPGVTIGTGSVIAAGSIVTRSVMPYEIVAGNPARTVRMRFDERTVDGLLDSEWWQYNFVEFELLDLSNPAVFLEQLEQAKATLWRYEPKKIRLAGIRDVG